MEVLMCLPFFGRLWLYEHLEYCELFPCLFRAIRGTNRKTWIACFDSLRRGSARDKSSNCRREYSYWNRAKLEVDAYTHRSIHQGSNLKHNNIIFLSNLIHHLFYRIRLEQGMYYHQSNIQLLN